MSSPASVDRGPDVSISDALTDLALDLRWSFNHSADELWEQFDPELRHQTQQPISGGASSIHASKLGQRDDMKRMG